MLYEETEKKEIERVYAVFADYIRESPYLEWLWSDKLGYLLLKISTKKRYVEEEILVDTADQLAEVLFSGRPVCPTPIHRTWWRPGSLEYQRARGGHRRN